MLKPKDRGRKLELVDTKAIFCECYLSSLLLSDCLPHFPPLPCPSPCHAHPQIGIKCSSGPQGENTILDNPTAQKFIVQASKKILVFFLGCSLQIPQEQLLLAHLS